MAYTGNWLRSAVQVQANPTHLAEPDAGHAESVGDQYPTDHQAPPGADYGGTEFGRAVVQTRGLEVDTPTRSHDGPARMGVFRNQLERQTAQMRGHEGQDRGWVRAAYSRRLPMQDDTTRYLEQTWTGNGSAAPTAEAVQRSGLNSLPQNNPDVPGYDPGGFRRGSRTWRSVDRKNRIDPRVYTAQQLLAREIRVPGQQPPQQGAWGRLSPFASMARPMRTVATSPGIFRAPGSLTESILEADDRDQDVDGGIAIDGMWAT